MSRRRLFVAAAAETAVCVAETTVRGGGCGDAGFRQRRWFAGGDAGLQAETPVCAGGCGDDGLQEQTTVCRQVVVR